MPYSFFIFVLSFAGVWISSELIISSMKKFTSRLNLSSFAASFFILGLLTSLPEISIGLNAVLEHRPVIFVGNLIGASVVLFLLIIPLLAVFGNGIKVTHDISEHHLILALIVILLPAFITLDGLINRKEAFVLLFWYLVLVYFLEKRKGLLEIFEEKFRLKSRFNMVDLTKVMLGAFMIYVSSHALIHSITPITTFLGIPTFVVSLLLLSIGTNIPELFITIQAVIKRQKDIAFGDYIGSAAANTPIFALLVFFNGPIKLNGEEYVMTFILFSIGLILFYFFARSKKQLSRNEGIVLLILYVIFITTELVLK